MNISNGKFGDVDPEMVNSSPATTAILDFDKLVAQVKQARSKPIAYDPTWTVLECLVNEVDRLRKELTNLQNAK